MDKVWNTFYDVFFLRQECLKSRRLNDPFIVERRLIKLDYFPGSEHADLMSAKKVPGRKKSSIISRI